MKVKVFRYDPEDLEDTERFCHEFEGWAREDPPKQIVLSHVFVVKDHVVLQYGFHEVGKIAKGIVVPGKPAPLN